MLAIPIALFARRPEYRGRRRLMADRRKDPMVELLLSIANRRDRHCFKQLFDHYAPRLTAYLQKAGCSIAVAEEVVQEVMLTVWRKADQYDPQRASANTWIYTIARNRHIDHVRKRRRPEPDPADPALVSPAARRTDDEMEIIERGKRLKEALGSLPEEQAAILERAYFQGESLRVIAEEMKIPLGTVKTRVRLALNRLRKAVTRPEFAL